MASMQATSIVRGHKFTFKYYPKGGTYTDLKMTKTSIPDEVHI